MKKLLYAILAFFALCLMLAACSDNAKDIWDTYEGWRNDNNAWLAEQEAAIDPATGKPLYQKVVAPWNPDGYILIRYINDRAETEGNLSPLYTSLVDVRYKGNLYTGAGFDSSDLKTQNGPGIFRTTLSGVIDGWTLALSEMRVGDTAQVIIPYNMGYGASGTSGAILPYSNLRFGIWFVDIVNYVTRP